MLKIVIPLMAAVSLAGLAGCGHAHHVVVHHVVVHQPVVVHPGPVHTHVVIVRPKRVIVVHHR